MFWSGLRYCYEGAEKLRIIAVSTYVIKTAYPLSVPGSKLSKFARPFEMSSWNMLPSELCWCTAVEFDRWSIGRCPRFLGTIAEMRIDFAAVSLSSHWLTPTRALLHAFNETEQTARGSYFGCRKLASRTLPSATSVSKQKWFSSTPRSLSLFSTCVASCSHAKVNDQERRGLTARGEVRFVYLSCLLFSRSVAGFSEAKASII